MTIQETFDAAVRHHQAARLGEAEGLYRQVVAQHPGHAGAMHMLGIAAHQSGRPADAVRWIRQAIEIDPGNGAYHNNLGNALQASGENRLAMASYRDAIARQSDLADAWNNLGNALQEDGQFAQAIEAHRRALSLRPNFPQAWYGLAGAFSRQSNPDAAIDAYEHAIQLRPAYTAAEVNRANVLRHIGRLDDAIDSLRRVVAGGATPVALSNLIYSLYFHPDHGTEQIRQYLAQWNELFAKPFKTMPPPHYDRSHDRRLKIGYVSPDFNAHPAGRFLLPLLAHHDHERFEIFCFSDSGGPDEVTEKLRSHADVWRATRGLSDEQLAARIRDDRIDVLIDLTLHLAGSRLLTFARKPAPVQATWLAYPGSSGLSTMDYRLSDAHLDPPGFNDALYSETTLQLPNCYWCYDPLCAAIDVGELPATRNGFITFGCLNNFAKVTGPTISLWAQVMGRVNESRLLILAPQGSARTRFLEAMKAHGIDASRVQFVDRQPRRQYMELYRQIDISLDTYPCNGHTTSFDSLWMGVPIVSLSGRTAMSRGGLSILSNLGMADWVTNDATRFVEMAVRVSQFVGQLGSLRQGLRSRLERSPLMDGRGFARDVEALYRHVWKTWCLGSLAADPTTPPAGG